MSRYGDTAAFACAASFGQLRGLRAGHRGGRRLLALHGWLDNAASFVPLAAELPGYDLVMLDLPGHGLSDRLPAGSDYSLSAAIHAVLDAADALDWPRFSLLGHSLGGGIASLIAAAVPERIEALVAIEALGVLGEELEHSAQRLRDSVAASRALPQRPLRLFPSLETAIRARMRANQLDHGNARLLVERGVETVPGGYRWRSDQRLTLPSAVRMSEARIQHLIAAIACPTQVIFATPAQPYLPDSVRRQRVAQLRDGQLAVLAGGHHLHMQDAPAVAQIIDAFLRAH